MSKPQLQSFPVPSSPVPSSLALPEPGLLGLAPVLDEHVEILVLGSFPGKASLDAGRYYAHPQNQCWRLLGSALDCPLDLMDYEDRLAALLSMRVGLWDALAACDRQGSLDSAIRNARPNDFSRLATLCPRLHKVGLNGKASAQCAPALRAAGYEVIELPSSSAAHASASFESKLLVWERLGPAPRPWREKQAP